MTLPAPTEPSWRPGDPVYPGNATRFHPMSYAAALRESCPPGCWCHVYPCRGIAMRWNPRFPALRFIPSGLHVTEADDKYEEEV